MLKRIGDFIPRWSREAATVRLDVYPAWGYIASMIHRVIDAKAFLEELDGPLTFGEAIHSIRVCDEETQEHFAARLGISKQHLCDIEKGRRTVGPARAAGWGKLLGYGEATFVRLALRTLLEAEGVPYDVKIVPYKPAKARRRTAKRRAARCLMGRTCAPKGYAGSRRRHSIRVWRRGSSQLPPCGYLASSVPKARWRWITA